MLDLSHADVPHLLTALAVGLLLALGAVLAWRSTGPVGHRWDLTTPGRMFVLLYLVSTGVGSVLYVALGWATGQGALVAALGLVVFGLAATLSAARWGRAAPLGPPAEPGQFRLPGLVGAALVGVLGYASIAVQAGIPLLTPDALQVRSSYGGIAFDLYRWLVPPLFLAALAVTLARPSWRGWALSAAAFAAVAGLEVLAGSRALPAEMALAALLIIWWAGRRLSGRVWVALALAALVVFTGVRLLRNGPGASFSSLGDFGYATAWRTLERVVLVQAQTLELIVTEIPAQQPYYMGSTYVRWLAPLRGQATPEPLGSWLFRQQFPGQPQGFVTPGFIGELWANGGPLLVALGMAAFGAALQQLGRVLGRLDRGAPDRVLAALLVVAAGRAYATSLNGLLLTMIVALAWRWVVAGPGPLVWTRRALGVRGARGAPRPKDPEATGGAVT